MNGIGGCNSHDGKSLVEGNTQQPRNHQEQIILFLDPFFFALEKRQHGQQDRREKYSGKRNSQGLNVMRRNLFYGNYIRAIEKIGGHKSGRRYEISWLRMIST